MLFFLCWLIRQKKNDHCFINGANDNLWDYWIFSTQKTSARCIGVYVKEQQKVVNSYVLKPELKGKMFFEFFYKYQFKRVVCIYIHYSLSKLICLFNKLSSHILNPDTSAVLLKIHNAVCSLMFSNKPLRASENHWIYSQNKNHAGTHHLCDF